MIKEVMNYAIKCDGCDTYVKGKVFTWFISRAVAIERAEKLGWKLKWNCSTTLDEMPVPKLEATCPECLKKPTGKTESLLEKSE